MRIDKDVPMTARDGVVLRADVYRPDGPGRFPVLLSRLPYDKNGRRRPGDIDVFVEHGYVVIMQDTRGRFASGGGEYEPLVWEAQDGHDAVEWAAQLPYADGNVGTMGQSYLGATQYLLAPTRPPHLRAAFPASAPADFHQCWAYHTGGAFELGWQIPYAILMARDTIERQGLTATLLPELERVLAPAPTPWAPPLGPDAYRRLPLTAWAELLEPVAKYLGDYLRHPEDGPPWWAINVERRHAEIAVPMYHVTSWYDIFLHGGITNFQGLRRSARTEPARAAQKLLIGPWAHLFPYTSPTSTGTGEIDFGAAALVDLHETQLRWFDHWLKGIDTGILDEPPIRIFVMGDNRWRDEHEWPLARTRYTPYYLGGGGRANTADGDGTLGPAAPGRGSARPLRLRPRRSRADARRQHAHPRHGRHGPAPRGGARRRARLHERGDDGRPRGDRARSWSRSTPRAPRPTPTSPRSSSTCTPTGMRGTWPTASCAPAIATRGPPPPSSRQVKSRNSPSTSGPRATCSCPAIGSASRSRRATSRASIAT